MNGVLICLEGLEGCGKSSALSCIENTLKAHNLPYFTTREPGGTPLGEQLRALVLHGPKMSLQSELFLMLAARSLLCEQVIKPKLEQGYIVITDRGPLSTLCYQGALRPDFDDFVTLVGSLNTFVNSDIYNQGRQYTGGDLCLLLDTDIATSKQRALSRGTLDNIEQRDIHFFTAVKSRYLTLAQRFNEQIKVIDANASISKVHHDINSALLSFLSQKKLI